MSLDTETLLEIKHIFGIEVCRDEEAKRLWNVEINGEPIHLCTSKKRANECALEIIQSIAKHVSPKYLEWLTEPL